MNLYVFVFKAVLDDSCRYSTDNRIGWNVLCHHGTRSDYGSVADFHPTYDRYTMSDQYIVPNARYTWVWPARKLDRRPSFVEAMISTGDDYVGRDDAIVSKANPGGYFRTGADVNEIAGNKSRLSNGNSLGGVESLSYFRAAVLRLQ